MLWSFLRLGIGVAACDPQTQVRQYDGSDRMTTAMTAFASASVKNVFRSAAVLQVNDFADWIHCLNARCHLMFVPLECNCLYTRGHVWRSVKSFMASACASSKDLK